MGTSTPVFSSVGDILLAILVFLDEIGVVLFFVLGVAIYLHALFHYFLIGDAQGEEAIKDEARKQFIWAAVAFLAGVALWAILQGVWWVVNLEIPARATEESRIQIVPNVPER